MQILNDFYQQEGALEKYVPTQGEVAIDIGANHGHWTDYLSCRFKEVHAIECQPGEANHIEHNSEPNVTVHNTALWSNIGRLMFRTHINPHGEHQGCICGADAFVVSQSSFNYYEVPCCTLDSLNIPGKIDFVKCDCDGSEVQVLVGAQAVLKRHHPTLLIETHTDENRAFLLCWLQKLGYAVEIVPEMQIRDITRWTDTVNYILAKVKNG